MFQEFVGKNCDVVVAFSTSVMDGGVATLTYKGQLMEDGEGFIKLNVTGARCDCVLGGCNRSGVTIINKQYVVAVSLSR